MRVAIADDSALFRNGLSALLDTADVHVTAQARTGAQLLALIHRDPPDAVILDIRMPPTFTDEGIATAAKLRVQHPQLAVLVLSTYAHAGYATRLLELGGGVGYLLKDRVDDIPTLRSALTRICTGEAVIEPEIVNRLMARRRHADALRLLTRREREVLELMAEGRSNAGISEHIFLSPKTVESHVASVFAKLSLTTTGVEHRRVLAVLTWLRASEQA